MQQEIKSFLGVKTNPGVSSGNMMVFYLTCLASILLGTFMNAFQPFLFSEIMAIPRSEHGVLSGKLNFAGEIAIISTVGLWGAVSDKIGRRLVMTLGFILVGVSFYLYPHAGSVNELLLYRVIYGVGIAAATCMIVTLLADFARDENRGKAAGFQGICNGLGAVLALFVLLRLPQFFQNAGQDAVQSGISTYNIVVIFALVMAVFSWLGLKSRASSHEGEKLPLLTMVANGIRAGRDPGIALAYGGAFVSRANLTIVGAFMTLWLSNYGMEEAGMSAADALKKAGIVVAMAQGVALLGAPFFGILTDKISRVNALIIALFISFVGYTSTYLISDPFGTAMLVVVVLIGLSEIGAIITSGVLIAQQTPPEKRGAVIGIFNLSGAVGILVSSLIGGYLFDHWDNSGPFVFIGLCALLVAVWGLMVRHKVVPYQKPAPDDAAMAVQEVPGNP
ncbi:MFS transporter [Alkalimonas sp. MEB108]|uniref:MFS transporter n=1 Tax=Alkalimonas cellulosilytica TaxID=3058395 RepID=A0ABU7J984_9GAMM|nr:MFS transporter [Alkalimonas sp. MEB108]MEE2002959.1 MFS transporter [Alkalimonas sp. MEB108]